MVELAAKILAAASEKAAKKTHLMNNGKLNSKQLKHYLHMLLAAELMSFDTANGSYLTSDKGKKFLEVYFMYSQERLEAEKLHSTASRRRVQLEQMCLPVSSV